MPNKPQRRGKPTPASSDEVLLATIRYKYAWCMTVRYVAIILSLGGLLWAATPLAHEIAGRNTNFNVNISLALTATFAVTTAAGYGYAAMQRVRAKHLETRNDALNRRIEKLQKDLEKYKGKEAPTRQSLGE